MGRGERGIRSHLGLMAHRTVAAVAGGAIGERADKEDKGSRRGGGESNEQ